jgi:hypothetical protein
MIYIIRNVITSCLSTQRDNISALCVRQAEIVKHRRFYVGKGSSFVGVCGVSVCACACTRSQYFNRCTC